jgi:hypothetical protein
MTAKIASLTMVTLFALGAPAFAQTTTPTATSSTPVDATQGGSHSTAGVNALSSTQRDEAQQQRIENGLKDGQLSTSEAAHLEGQEARVDRMQANALKDGNYSAAEKAKIDAAQAKMNQSIHTDMNNSVKGNTSSSADQHMQEIVQRDVHQQQRIAGGIQNGHMTNQEAANAERGQSWSARAQAAAGRDNHIGPYQRRAINQTQDQASHQIHNERHNGTMRR